MKNNKGFTLVEILAVVVVLGIIVLISTNMVLKQVRKSKKQAFITDVQQIVKSTGYETLVKDNIDKFVMYKFPNSGIDILPNKKTKIKENGETKTIDLYSGFMIKDEDDNVRIQIWNRELNSCAVKPFTDSEVKIDESIKTEKECGMFLNDLKNNDAISVKSLTGEDVDYKIKASCFTLDDEGKIDNFDTSECGTSLIVPNKINGTSVTGFTDDFYDNSPRDFTSLYIVGVEGLTETSTGLLSGNLDFKKLVMSDLPNLVTINAGLVSNIPDIDTFYLANCPKLENLNSGVMASGDNNLRNLTLENLPKLKTLNSVFYNTKITKLNITGLDSLTQISYSSFQNMDGDAEIVISDNPNLTIIQAGVFSTSNIKSLEICNNDSLTTITSSTTNYDSNKHFYIDELSIHDNPNFETIENSSFTGFEYKTIKLYNMPKLKNIRYGAFGSIKADLVDLSGLELDEFNFSAFGGSQIAKLILPSTINSFQYGNAGNFNSFVTGKIEFGGSDKCSLINLFRSSNPDGTYTYMVDKNKLPTCP